MAISDPIKASTPAALKTLQELGLCVVMLNGDARATARSVARHLGIDEFHVGVSPQDKRESVRQLKRDGKTVAAAMSLSSVSVISNALPLRSVPLT